MSRLVVVSNRTPRHEQAGEPTPGGLVSALQSVIAAGEEALWFGWDGTVADTSAVTRTASGNVEFVSLALTEVEFTGYYQRFSNEVLWPALHSVVERVGDPGDAYATYREVNERFAQILAEELQPDDLVWVHDYHLIPLGRSLRDRGFAGRIGYFHHVPFPSAEIWRSVPHAEDLAETFSFYDLVGVQTALDQEHLRAIVDPQTADAIEVFPISIDPDEVRAYLSEMRSCRTSAGTDVTDRPFTFFGVDRLDYTKGIPQRIEAYRQALERTPSMRETRFVQWAALSREGLQEYEAERASIVSAAEDVWGRFPTNLDLSCQRRPRAEVIDALARADVCVVNSVADGMNLVAKEFAAVHSAESPGVLILSDGCGASQELSSALIVRAGDVEELARALERAYDMPHDERVRRSAELRAQVDRHTSADWARNFVAALERRPREEHQSGDTPLLVRAGRFEGELEDRTEERLRILQREDTIARLWARDLDLWDGRPEVAERLGWLELDERMRREIPQLTAFAGDVVRDGFTSALLIGMGGSAMAPRVFAQSIGGNGLPVRVLDSTVPAAIRATEETLDPEHTLFVVSSKSGSTSETVHLLEYFWAMHPDGRRFVAVTDPDTPLHEMAIERGFRAVFLNPPDIGGRFSALSFSGLVAASLAGTDLEALLRGAREMCEACSPEVGSHLNPGARLGAALAEAAFMGRDVLSLSGDRQQAPLRAWVEQLLAESTGKRGGGILPVLHTPAEGLDMPMDVQRHLLDEHALRHVAGGTFDPSTASELGAEYVRWEIGVALAGSILGLNPFDQPDVESTKVATLTCLEEGLRAGGSAAPGDLVVPDGPDGYVSIQAYLSGSNDERTRLKRVRNRVEAATGVPTMLEYGPSFLHSTGQYHKAGRRRGAFIQVMPDASEPLAVPGEAYTFDDFLRAQACGDGAVLEARGRPVVGATLGQLEAQF